MQIFLFNNLVPMQKNKLVEMNPLSLAFLGDAVHTLFVRNFICKEHGYSHTKQHFESAKFCKASCQSSVLERILPLLVEDELAIIKRARNVKNSHIAKNSNPEDYKKSTSFEALVGYLFLRGDDEKLDLILKESIKEFHNDN